MLIPFFLIGLVAAVVTVLRARLETATLVLFGVLFLVPGNLVLPGFHSSMPAFRVVLWGYVAGLALRAVRGEIDRGAFRPTAVQGALAAFIVVALVNGIALTPVDNGLVDASLRWLSFLDQLVVFTAVLVASRTLGIRWVAKAIAGFSVAVGGIAVWEHFSETSYARTIFSYAGRPNLPVAASRLQPRGEEVRVRGPYQFALEFSWVVVMVLPLVLLLAARARRRIALLGPAILGLALLWSWSRSSWSGVALGLVVLGVAAGLDRRTALAVGAVAVVAALVLLVNPAVLNPFDAADEDSAESRTRRMALITEELADDAYTGLGLAGLTSRGQGGADATYVLIYAYLGVPGVLTLGIAHVAAAATCVVALRDRRRRPLMGAVLGGVLAGILGNFALDLMATPGTSKLFWIIAALGAAAVPGVPGDSGPRVRRSRARLLLPPVALCIGVGVVSLWPTHVATTYRFETIERPELAFTSADVVWGGHYLVGTTCELIGLRSDVLPPGDVDCIDGREAAGIGYLRIETSDLLGNTALESAIEAEVTPVVPGFVLHQLHRDEGRPTVIRTMPLWLTGLAVAAIWLVPPRPWSAAGTTERHRATAPVGSVN